MAEGWDETIYRLTYWTKDSAQAEFLGWQVLHHAGFEAIDPSHPFGGPDGGKDAVCLKDGEHWIMASYFPRKPVSFAALRTKFLSDLLGVVRNGAVGMAFVTNQTLTGGERGKLLRAASGAHVDLFHRDRVAHILDTPEMRAVRKQHLGIDHEPSVEAALLSLTNPTRDEQEVRLALEGIASAERDLRGRGVEPGLSRCPRCQSGDVRRHSGDYNGRLVSFTQCQECDDVFDDCC